MLAATLWSSTTRQVSWSGCGGDFDCTRVRVPVDYTDPGRDSLGEGCESRSPQIAPYVDTESVARDLDILRAVLGEEQLDFLGQSYGTLLGAQYAELFPARVGRMVLDGVLPSSLDFDELAFGQAKAHDVALRRFVAHCATQDDCPLPTGSVDGGSPGSRRSWPIWTRTRCRTHNSGADPCARSVSSRPRGRDG